MHQDLVLRRVERTSMLACGVMALTALAIARGRPGPAAGVVGGWILFAIGYRAITAGVEAIAGGAQIDAASRRRRLIAAIVKITGRHALLAILAYVMIARLRLHPLGLLAGASSGVAAVSIEAIRLLVKKRN